MAVGSADLQAWEMRVCGRLRTRGFASRAAGWLPKHRDCALVVVELDDLIALPGELRIDVRAIVRA